MAALTGNINPQNVVDRFSDYVTATANSGIDWDDDNAPFPEFPRTSHMKGKRTTGIPKSVSGSNIGTPGEPITAASIYAALVAETRNYTRIRQVRGRRFVEGGGGNVGSRPNAGYDVDAVSIAIMNEAYIQDIGQPNNPWVQTDQPATADGLQQLFDSLRAAYLAARANTVILDQNVCHASCHSSCHGSRGRR